MDNKNTMLGSVLAEVVGPLQDLFQKLKGSEGLQWLAELKHFLRKEPTWVSRLLRKVGDIQVGGNDRFIVRDKFKVDTSASAEVPISYMSEAFQRLLLDKVETDVEAAILNIHNLEQGSLDAPILAELGDRAETKLGQLYDFLKTASREHYYVVYIMDGNGVLWAVSFRWSGDGWYFYVYSVENPYGWDAGRRVLSR